MTTTQTNINSAAYRLDARRTNAQPCERCKAATATYCELVQIGNRYGREMVCAGCKTTKGAN